MQLQSCAFYWINDGYGYGEQQKHKQKHLAPAITTFLLVFVHQSS